MVLVLVAFDFWIVKNIIGRKLVKLRWWFTIDPQTGGEKMLYEYQPAKINATDWMIFWGGLLVNPGLWGLCCVLNVITF